jgi:hypothetical protein
LAEFLNFCIGYIDQRPREVRQRLSDLERLFREAGCSRYVHWLPRSSDPCYQPFIPTPEEEKAALRAALAALGIFYGTPWHNPADTPLTQKKQRQRDGLCQRAIQAAQDRLNVLDGNKPGAGGPVVPPEWEGDDWEALDPKVRQLLLHMRGRDEADLQELCLAVWGKDSADVSEAARETATSKANNFLRKREFRRLLRKVRGENRLRWK